MINYNTLGQEIVQNAVEELLSSRFPKTEDEMIAQSVLIRAVVEADNFRKTVKDWLADDNLRNIAQDLLDQTSGTSASLDGVLSSVRQYLVDTLHHKTTRQVNYLETVALCNEMPADILAEFAFRYNFSSDMDARNYHERWVLPALGAVRRDIDSEAMQKIVNSVQDIEIREVEHFL